MKSRTFWGIHMPRDFGLEPVEKGYVAIGWHEMGDLRQLPATRDGIKAEYASVYPEAKPGEIPVGAGLLLRLYIPGPVLGSKE